MASPLAPANNIRWERALPESEPRTETSRRGECHPPATSPLDIYMAYKDWILCALRDCTLRIIIWESRAEIFIQF